MKGERSPAQNGVGVISNSVANHQTAYWPVDLFVVWRCPPSPLVDTPCTKQYVVYWDGDTIYTKQYAVFSRGRY